MRAPTRLLACLALVSPLALADDTLRWLDQERRQRETVERDQRLRQLQRQTLPPEPTHTPGNSTSDSQCWAMTGVQLSGNQLIDAYTLQAAITPHLSPCMGVSAIRHVLATITQAYVQHGYIAARAYPTHAPADGQPLAIVIDEGFVESIELDDPHLPVSLGGAFPSVIGHPLHLPTLEQGLDQLNRLRSVDLEVQIAPGELDGGSRIVLTPRSHPSPWGLRMGYSNGGDIASGRHGTSLVISHDNPLHLNDALQLSLFRTQGNAPNLTRGLGLYYNVPYGPWTLGASLARSQQLAFTPVHGYRGESLSANHSVNLTRHLWRNQQALLSATLRLNQKSQARWFNHARQTVPDGRLTSASLDLNFLWLGRATWSTQLGYGHSLPWLNTRARRHQQWRAAVLRTQVWPGAGYQWRWDSSVEAQYSPHRLPASEQWLLTSPTSVRGFRDSSIAASSAAVWRNSVALALPLPTGLVLTPHLAVDYGRGWDTWTTDRQHPALAAVSGGASLAWSGGEVKLDYRHATVIKDGPPSEPGFWNMELKLDF